MTEDPGKTPTPEQCLTWILSMLQGLIVYDIKERELRLALILILDSYGKGAQAGKVDLRAWAKELGLEYGREIREDKAEALFEELTKLQMVDWNRIGAAPQGAPQGTFELRPSVEFWSKLRAVRSTARQTGANEGLLSLSAERPVSEATSELAREKAVAGSVAPPIPEQEDYRAQFEKLKTAVMAGTVDRDFAELLNRPTEKVGAPRPFLPGLPAEKVGGAQPVPILAVKAPTEKVGGSRTAEADQCTAEQIRSALKLKLSSAVGEPSKPVDQQKVTEALEWLWSVDAGRHQTDRVVWEHWQELCHADPGYVLTKLRGALDDNRRRVECGELKPSEGIADPLAWLSAKAISQNKLRQIRGKRAR